MTIELKTAEPVETDEDEERIEIFSLDGTSYTIPNKARPNVSFQYLYIARTEGLVLAESWLAEEMLGTEAYMALINWPDLNSEIWNQVIAAARSVVFGDAAPKSGTKSTGGQKRRKPPRST